MKKESITKKMTIENFLEIVKEIANADTSADPNGWTQNNPLWGHCAVVSLLAQEIFGGELIKGSLKNHQKYSYLKSHIWNRIDGKDIDFTKDQYLDLSYKDLVGEVCTRDLILNHPDTIKRFNLLKTRFISKTNYPK